MPELKTIHARIHKPEDVQYTNNSPHHNEMIIKTDHGEIIVTIPAGGVTLAVAMDLVKAEVAREKQDVEHEIQVLTVFEIAV